MNTLRNYWRVYTVSGFLKLCCSLIRTKLFYPSAKIIRFPFDLRGKKNIKWGKNFTTGFGCRLEAYAADKKAIVLSIGDNVQINDYVHITAMRSVVIGDNVLLASKIYISDNTHGDYNSLNQEQSNPDIPAKNRVYKINDVLIEDNVWIGEGVSILPGVNIGKGTIVGANSVVSKDLPSYVIAVGIPAKPIKKYNFETNRWEKINNHE